ncbi:acyltransferase [Sulfuricella sp.]|uniref:acyltransferase family protein n=1 Tax=Sulfuricella sp. TaxID=2099377 RepID=UPI002C53733B|nr:acyltransferase [Sulfuricella sp.]HUX62984.1 acyltransferase [Sulfuricella sp.]
MSATPRFANLDKLRGFAALSVVLYHVIEHTHWTTYPTSGLFFWGRIGWMGVDLFFVISGLVITYSAWSLYHTQGVDWKSHYWRRRLTRIVPLYLLTSAMYVTLVQPEWMSVSIKGILWHGVTHLLFIHNLFPGTHGSINGVNWSIGVEMQFYFLVALVLPWIVRTSALVLIATFFTIAWAWRAAVFGLLGDQGAFLLFQYTTQLPGTLDQFVLGILLCKIMLDPKYVSVAEWIKQHYAIVILGGLVTGIVMFSIYINHADYWPNNWMVIFFRTLIGAAACAIILSATLWPWKVPRIMSRPLDFLGEISYGIYLWHLPVIFSLKRLGVGPGFPFLVWTLFVTIILATLSYYLFERSWMRSARLKPQGQLNLSLP